MKKTILIIIIFLQFGKVEAQGNVGLQIIGNWNITNINSEGDEVLSTTKWIFLNDGKCNVYIDNQLMQSYFYTITNTECDSGLIDNENFHLKLQSTSDQKLVECYIFMGFANIDGLQTLSLLAYGATDPILFKKVL
jgi:hypothetical protein